MSSPFLGQIIMFGGNFAPRSTAFCNGQLLSIAQNNALFALLGTTYGGDGITTFALPNLQCRLPLHQGQGPGLTNRVLGEASGTESVTLTTTTIPSHSHTLNATTAAATAAAVGNTLLPGTPTVSDGYAYATQLGSPNPALVPQTLAAGACGFAGGSQPHDNMMPSLCISFVIALEGIFPSQN